MSYSKKASKVASNGQSNVDWDEFNEHKLEVIGEDLESRLAVISGIVELGLQGRPDYVEKYKGTPEQEEKLKNKNTYLSEDETEIITEMSNAEQVAIFVDYPELMINYGKYFSEDGEDDFKPYRHLLTNTFWDKGEKKHIAKGVALSCRYNEDAPSGYAYDPKSTIAKLAVSSGAVTGRIVDQDFDIGELLGRVITTELQAVKDGDYINIKHKGINKKHSSIPEHENEKLVEPFGISFDGGNDEETLKLIAGKKDIRNALERALNWEDSGLKQDLEEFAKANKSSSKNDDEEEEETPRKKTTKKPTGKKAPTKKLESTKPDPEDDDDEDDPFGED